MSNLQTQLIIKRDKKKEETYVLLRQKYTTFFEAHKVLQDHLEEFVSTKEVLRSWYTHYGQVFQQAWETREHIQNLEKQQGLDDTIIRTIQDQIILETTKLEKLEKNAHQWTTQALLSISTLDNIYP